MKKVWKLLSWVLIFVVLVVAVWALSGAINWLGTIDTALAGTVITAIGAVIGLLYTQWHSKSREISEGHRPKKIEVYNTFFDIIESFIEQAKQDDIDLTEVDEIPEDLKQKFSDFNRGLVIWASPTVIRAWLKFRAQSGKGQADLLLDVDDMLQAIRKDLGNSNFGLKRGDVIKQYLSDPTELDRMTSG